MATTIWRPPPADSRTATGCVGSTCTILTITRLGPVRVITDWRGLVVQHADDGFRCPVMRKWLNDVEVADQAVGCGKVAPGTVRIWFFDDAIPRVGLFLPYLLRFELEDGASPEAASPGRSIVCAGFAFLVCSN